MYAQQGKWGVYVPTSKGTNMQFYMCPAGYCSCKHDSDISNNTCVYSYVHSNPDLQCTCGRIGMYFTQGCLLCIVVYVYYVVSQALCVGSVAGRVRE